MIKLRRGKIDIREIYLHASIAGEVHNDSEYMFTNRFIVKRKLNISEDFLQVINL